MTGYDKKKISNTADKDVNITLEIDFNLKGSHSCKTFAVKAGQTISYEFLNGFSAH